MSLPPLPPPCYQHALKFSFFILLRLTTGTRPLPKKVFHTARSSASSFSLQYPLIFLRASSGFLTSSSSSSRHDYLSFYLSFNNVFWKAVPLHKMWPIQLASILFIVCGTFLFSSTLCNTSSILAQSVQLISSILHHYISNFPDISEVSKFRHHTQLHSKCSTVLVSSLNLSPITHYRKSEVRRSAGTCMRTARLPRQPTFIPL